MSTNLLLVADALSGLIAIGFLALASYRAFRFRHILVGQVYRSRALWTGLYGVAAIAFLVQSLLYVTGTTSLQLVYFARPPGLVALYALMDSSIQAALDQDHFHRNTLYWRIVRRVFWIIIPTLALFDGILEYTNGYSLEANPLAFATVGGVLGYSAIVLIVCSHRTPDEPMKRFVLWLGLGGATVVVSIIASNLTSNLTATSPFLPLMVGSIFWYQATRSLSPTSHIEKENNAR